MRLLDQAKIPYTPHFYPHEGKPVDGETVARLTGLPPETVFKTLVTRGSGPVRFFIFVIPVGKELDLKAAARAAGEKAVSMVHAAEVTPITGYVRGGCSPVGMKKLYPTYIDLSAQGMRTIAVSAGRIGAQVELAPGDLARCVGGVFAPLTL